MFAAYELYHPVLHGGSANDRPDGQCLMLWRITEMADICAAVLFGKRIGRVVPYEWTSPVTRSEYTLCTPLGIIILQREWRRRFLGPVCRLLLRTQATGASLLHALRRSISRRRRRRLLPLLERDVAYHGGARDPLHDTLLPQNVP